jgi:hypothetical protein
MIDLSQIGRELENLEPRTIAYAGSALLSILLLLVFWRWYRRRRARAALLAAITGGAYEYHRDVLLPDGQGGSLHIDFLLLTARGCVVIDMRDIAGNIFGGDQMTEWTVMHRAQRYTFPNPQAGLYDRIAAVRALAVDLPVEGRVVFSSRGTFPKGLPRYTLMLNSVASEYPAAEREQSGAMPELWRADWGRLTTACRPSKLMDPKPAI